MTDQSNLPPGFLPQQQPSVAASMRSVLAGATLSENRDLMECLTEDLNGFLSGLGRLTPRARATAPDLAKLLKRFELTLSMLEPQPQPTVADYAPRNAGASGLRAVDQAVNGAQPTENGDANSRATVGRVTRGDDITRIDRA